MSDRQDFRIAFYDKQVARIVDGLRSLADDIERQGQPYGKPGVTGTPRHLAAAEQVNHALTWGLANLGTYRLFDAAHHADVAETTHAATADTDERGRA